MPDQQIPEWLKIILSGLLGSLIGGLITFLVASNQLKTMGRLQKDAFDHQNKMLQVTFENGVNIIAFERWLDIRLRFLNEIYDHLSTSHNKAYIPGHQLRNSWRDVIRINGVRKLLIDIRELQNEISESIVGFVKILENYDYFDDLRDKFKDTLKFQKKVSEPISIFYDSLERLPDKPEEKILALVDQKAKDFSRAVDEFDNWLSETKLLVKEEQKKLFGEKQYMLHKNKEKAQNLKMPPD